MTDSKENKNGFFIEKANVTIWYTLAPGNKQIVFGKEIALKNAEQKLEMAQKAIKKCNDHGDVYIAPTSSAEIMLCYVRKLPDEFGYHNYKRQLKALMFNGIQFLKIITQQQIGG